MRPAPCAGARSVAARRAPRARLRSRAKWREVAPYSARRQGCRRRWRWHGCRPELLADLTRWLPNQREARARHVDPPLIPARGVRPDLRAQRCVSVRPRGVLSRSDVHDHISSEAAAKLSRRSCNRQSGAQVDRLHGGARIQCPRPREPGQAKGTHTGKVFYALNCVFEENAAYEAIVKSVVYVKPKWFPGKIGVNQMGAVGLYKTGYKSSCHCHVLPVKNLMLSGMKSWKFWAPGTFAKLNHHELPTAPPATPPAVCITQEGGDVLWIPPGWLHSVDTIQEGPTATQFGPGQQFVSAGADRHGARAACRQGCRRRWRWHGCSPELLADLTRWLPNQREARARHVDPPLIPA